MPRGRWSGVAAALGRGAEPRVLGEVEERGRVNAGNPLDLGSQGGRECRATRGRRPPVGTSPVAEGTTSMYWAIAASDGTVGGGTAAIAGDATTTATPAEQVAAMSQRIDD